MRRFGAIGVSTVVLTIVWFVLDRPSMDFWPTGAVGWKSVFATAYLLSQSFRTPEPVHSPTADDSQVEPLAETSS